MTTLPRSLVHGGGWPKLSGWQWSMAKFFHVMSPRQPAKNWKKIRQPTSFPLVKKFALTLTSP